MRHAILVVSALILVSAPCILAQGTPLASPRPAAGVGSIQGRLADSTSGQAITIGSVTIRRQRDTSLVGGTSPNPDGTFRIDGLEPGQYILRFRAIGFAPLTRNGLVVSLDKPVVNLGTLKPNVVATVLAGQQVTVDRDAESLSPDRNSYSTKNMTSAAGGTAIDVLRNIPLVEVDQSNNVTLRNNSNVVVQINGRATPLKGDQLPIFLGQLPASMVKTVEVATNPSAKDDPEGTAGIINIILKQDVELGLSGGINAGTATTGQVNLSGNVGKQQGKFTGFVSGSVYSDHRQSTGTISRTNLLIPVPAFVETRLGGRQQPFGTGGSLRTEYRLNETDAFTFDGYLYGGIFRSTNASYYSNLDQTRTLIGAFDQFNAQESRYLSQDFDFAFRRQGKPNTQQLTAEVEYANNYNSGDVDLSGAVLKADATTAGSFLTEQDKTIGRYPYMNAKLDYSLPFNPNAKLETGFKGTRRNTTNDFTASSFNEATGEYELNPDRTNGFNYHENIIGAYGLYSQRIAKVQLQTGFRLEDANTHFVLPSIARTFDKEYWSAYPSMVLSYNMTELRQAKVSYSRRVSRPDPYQLSPIEFKQDSRNVYHGNPNLGAEYSNSYDLTLQEARSWGSMQLNSYLRLTDHAVRNIQFVDTSGIFVRTFQNVANTRTVGADLNVNYRHGPIQLYANGSASSYRSDASNLSQNLSARAVLWSTRLNGTWKFSDVFDVQGYGSYRAPFTTEGGSQLATATVAASARYKIWGDKGNVSVRLADPFKLQKSGYRTANGTVLESSERYNGARAVFLTVSRNFGEALKLRPKSDPEIPQGGPPPGS